VLTLPETIGNNVVVTVDHTQLDENFITQSDVSATNNSTATGPTFLSAVVVTTGQYLKITLDRSIYAHTWGNDEFEVELNGTDTATITSVYSLDNNPDIWIYMQDLILSTDTVTIEFLTTDDPQLDVFSPQSVTNNSTQTSQSSIPPVYSMTEELSVVSGVYYLHNSADSGTIYDGKLCKPNGDPMTETEANARYNSSEGTIDLSDDYYVDTQWIESDTADWNITGNYDVISGSSFKSYNIDFDFSASTVDIRLIDQDDEEFPEDPTYADVAYTPNTSSTWKITENAPDIIYPSKLTFEMDSYTTV